MAVIPRGTVGRGLEFIDAGITWCETALGNTWNTILVVGIELADSVPVNRGSIVIQGIVNGDPDGIAPVANNSGARDLTVDGKSRSLGSLEVPLNAGDCEVIFANSAGGRGGCVRVSVDVQSIAP
jgi:hypothetical protein